MNDETARAFSAISALTPEQARDALEFLSGYTQAGFRAALECAAPSVLVDAAIARDPDGVAGSIIAALSHDMPSCGSCGAQDVPLEDGQCQKHTKAGAR